LPKVDLNKKFFSPDDLQTEELNKILALAQQYPNINEEERANLIEKTTRFSIRQVIDTLLNKPEYSKEIGSGILAQMMQTAVESQVPNNIVFYTLRNKPFNPALAGKLVGIALVDKHDDLAATQLLDQLNQQNIKIPTVYDGASLYLPAVGYDNIHLLDALHLQDNNIDFQDLETLDYPIGIALAQKKLKSIQWLLDHNVSLQLKDDEGETPIFQMVRLEDAASDDNINNTKNTLADDSIALEIAPSVEEDKMIQDIYSAILSRTSLEDLRAREYVLNITPLAYAAGMGNITVVKKIVTKMGPGLFAAQRDEALYCCVEKGMDKATRGQLATADFLLQNGPTFNYQNEQGRSIRDYIAQINDRQMAQLLLRYLNKDPKYRPAQQKYLPYSKPNWIADINSLDNINFNIDVIACALSGSKSTKEDLQNYVNWAFWALLLNPPKVEIAQMLLALELCSPDRIIDALSKKGLDGPGLIALTGMTSLRGIAKSMQIIHIVASSQNKHLLEYILEFTPNYPALLDLTLKYATDPKAIKLLTDIKHEQTRISEALQNSKTAQPDLETQLRLREELFRAIAQQDKLRVLDLVSNGVDLNFEQESFPALYVKRPEGTVKVAGLTPLSFACGLDDHGHMAEFLLALGANVHFANKVSISHYSQDIIVHENLRSLDKINLCRKMISASKIQPHPKVPLRYETLLGNRKKIEEQQLEIESKAAKQITAFMIKRQKARDKKVQSEVSPQQSKPKGLRNPRNKPKD
jgi:hypothetical protein